MKNYWQLTIGLMLTAMLGASVVKADSDMLSYVPSDYDAIVQCRIDRVMAQPDLAGLFRGKKWERFRSRLDDKLLPFGVQPEEVITSLVLAGSVNKDSEMPFILIKTGISAGKAVELLQAKNILYQTKAFNNITMYILDNATLEKACGDKKSRHCRKFQEKHADKTAAYAYLEDDIVLVGEKSDLEVYLNDKIMNAPFAHTFYTPKQGDADSSVFQVSVKAPLEEMQKGGMTMSYDTSAKTLKINAECEAADSQAAAGMVMKVKGILMFICGMHFTKAPELGLELNKQISVSSSGNVMRLDATIPLHILNKLVEDINQFSPHQHKNIDIDFDVDIASDAREKAKAKAAKGLTITVEK